MVEEGALAGEERTGHFEGFRMPIFGLEFTRALYRRGEILLTGLQDEAHFCRDAEIGYAHKGYFFEEGVSGELAFVTALG